MIGLGMTFTGGNEVALGHNCGADIVVTMRDGSRISCPSGPNTLNANVVKDPVVFPISAETALQDGGMATSGMPELLTHLTTFLAEERGRILLDNALGEGVNVGNLLSKGVDARRRSLARQGQARRPWLHKAVRNDLATHSPGRADRSRIRRPPGAISRSASFPR